MKKILSVFLIAFIAFSSVFTGVSVFAEEADYTVEKYNPAEITFISAKKYTNAYREVDIDAVFTHEDGTQVKTIGFWKEGSTFAVRFTPSKVGKWTYTVSCSDTENADIHGKTGVVLCKENDGSSETEKHGFIKIHESNRYFTYDDGTPFFWLGDTNWQAPNYVQTNACNYPGCRCNNQFKHEVDDRKAKGFNVYQTYFDSATSDGGGQRGILPSIWKKTFSEPNVEVFNEKIDYMFKYLHDQGMVIALGLGVHTSTVNNMPEKDFLRFVRYVIARYSCYSLTWIAGQEITDNKIANATPGKTALEVYMEGCALIDELDGYNHPNGTHMYPMPSSDERAQKLDAAPWHEWWALQGGHGRHIREKSFYQSYFLSSLGTIKPYIEAEANYEDINCGGFTGYDANRYSAWNAVLNGCCGFTYGVSGIWANCYSTEKNTGWFGPSSYSYEPWYMGLDKPGSYEVKYMKEFFDRLDWTKLIPRFYNTAYADFANDEKKDITATEDMSTVVCYFQNKSKDTGTIKMLDESKTYNAYWFNPLTGKYISLGKATLAGNWYQVPEKPTEQDWVFLLTAEDMGELPYEEAYKDVEGTTEITGNIVTPKKVTAVGGVVYLNGRKVDNTALLYDLDGKAAWEPLSDRVTQTIIYDLGAAYSLTHLVIAPCDETVLPDYRIEVSNDNNSWKILANTAIRDAKMLDKNVSEPLSGNYRYVKILLLNAEDVDPAVAKQEGYAVTYNEKNSDSYYSHTAIAEISVFASGLADKADTEFTPEVTPTPGEENKTPVENKSGLSLPVAIGIIGGSAVVGIIIGVVISVVIKKKNKKD